MSSERHSYYTYEDEAKSERKAREFIFLMWVLMRNNPVITKWWDDNCWDWVYSCVDRKYPNP